MDDMERSVSTEAAREADSPDMIEEKIALLNDLNEKIDDHKVDVDDVATFGESALEFVTSYDPDNLCKSAVGLNLHLQDVQSRSVFQYNLYLYNSYIINDDFILSSR